MLKKQIVYAGVLIFALAFLLRSYRLADTMIFASDQGEFLLDAASLQQEKKLRLIGIYVSSKQVGDKYFFIGSQFSYFLSLSQRLLGHDPLRLTLLFCFINSLAVALSFLAAYKISGNSLASLGVAMIYAANFFAIKYSRTIWNPALQPFLSVLTILVIVYLARRLRIQAWLVGLILGTSFAIEYSSVIIVPFVVYMLLIGRKQSERIESLLFLLVGFLIGIANLIIFDLRHDFYNSRLILKYYLTYSQGFSLSPHYLLSLLPFFCIGVVWVGAKLVKRRILIASIVIMIVFLETGYYYSKLVNNMELFGMPEALTYRKINNAAKLVVGDGPLNFNIAQLVDSDTRSFSLRYLLGYSYGLRGNMRETNEYSLSDTLYVLHYSWQDVERDGSFELTSFSGMRRIVDSWNLGDGVVLSKVVAL